MNYAFALGSAGVLASMHRQDVAANNLVNVETIGFKPDFSSTIPRAAARQEDNLYDLPSNALLERLGAGVLLAPTRTNFEQGALAESKNPFDLAIRGDGFLAVAVTSSEQGDAVALTRDGRLTMDASGRLVTATAGHPVLDEAGRPIELDRSKSFQVSTDGTISQNGAEVAKLRFMDVPDRDRLRKIGDNLFIPTASALASRTPATGEIIQNALERSSVDPIRAMLAVQSAASGAQATVRIMQTVDETLNRAINTLGRGVTA